MNLTLLVLIYFAVNLLMLILTTVYFDEWLDVVRDDLRVWHILFAILFCPGILGGLVLMIMSLLMYLILMPIGWILTLRVTRSK